MVEKSLSFALTLFVDLVDPDLFIPGGDCEVFTGGRETEVGDTVLWRGVQGNVFGDIAGGGGLAGGGGATDGSEERHSGRLLVSRRDRSREEEGRENSRRGEAGRRRHKQI
jgi:hypothetical protein